MHPYTERLRAAMDRSRSLLCVGLDPDPGRLPVADVAEFNRRVVDATAGLACAYKPNLSAYEALGAPGLAALERTVEHVRSAVPWAVLIGDAKRGDVGPSAAAYARSLFEVWGFDAATVNPYAGGESLAPFLSYADRAVYAWCRSSNPGASELQDLRLEGGARVFERVAELAARWESAAAVGLVAGATYPGDVAAIRRIAPDAPLLSPGVGAQGGDLAATVEAGAGPDGRGIVISSSRGVIHASEHAADFERAARDAALDLRRRIASALGSMGAGW